MPKKRKAKGARKKPRSAAQRAAAKARKATATRKPPKRRKSKARKSKRPAPRKPAHTAKRTTARSGGSKGGAPLTPQEAQGMRVLAKIVDSKFAATGNPKHDAPEIRKLSASERNALLAADRRIRKAAGIN